MKLEQAMKRYLILTACTAFTMSILGCSAEVGDPDHDSSYKKTTTYDENGKTVKTEKTVEKD